MDSLGKSVEGGPFTIPAFNLDSIVPILRSIRSRQLCTLVGLHLYAHCLRGTPGGVAVLAINNSVSQPASFTLPMEAVRYTLTLERPQAANVLLNGRELRGW